MVDRLKFIWDSPRPCVHPLVAPNGAVLTVDAPVDHPWHHGLWFAIKFVNGENFWEEYDTFGVLRTTSVAVADGVTHADIEWVRPNGEVVVDEIRRISSTEIDNDCFVIDWSEQLVPRVDVVFDRTPFTTWGGYGGLTFRGAPTFVDTKLRTSDGVFERRLGEPSRWCAIDGVAQTASGEGAEAGIVIVDSPCNDAAPVPWYASTRAATYGQGWANFVNAAMLWNGPLTVAAGTLVELEYRIIVHSGTWTADECDRRVRELAR